MFRSVFFLLICVVACGNSTETETDTDIRISEELQWSERMAKSIMARNPNPITIDFRDDPKWEYTHGLVLKLIEEVWKETDNDDYLNYIDWYYDQMIDDEGNVLTYDITRFNIDRINPGRALFNLYDQTSKEKYSKVIERLRYHIQW